LVTVLETAWNPTSPSGVERHYEALIPDDMLGRRVWVFPDVYAVGAADRGEDNYRHMVGVVVAERYPQSQGRAPTVAWTDERVQFVYDRIVQGFDFSKDGALEFGGRYVWTESIDEVTVYNEVELVQNRLFLSETRLTFAEHLA
jgi:hypothetical protein